jgi:hypothetical protein
MDRGYRLALVLMPAACVLLLSYGVGVLSGASGPKAKARPLFNGKTLEGWQMSHPGSFVVEAGAIKTVRGGKGILAYNREKIGNATLRVVYKQSGTKANSGIFIRIPEKTTSESYAIHNGIEVQIDDNDNEYRATGVLYSMTQALARPYKPAGEWNVMEITMDGLRTIVKLNGVLVTDYDGVASVPARKFPWEPERKPRPAEGYIALQNHDDRASIYFREISLVPLAK